MTAKPINSTTYQLSFPQLEREIPCRADETLFQSARRHGVRIVGACGGRGACGSCMVSVIKGDVENSETSKPLISNTKKWQQACNLHPLSDCTLEIAARSLAKVVRAEAENVEGEFLPLDPLIEIQDVSLAPATLEDPRSDLDRLADVLGVEAHLADLMALRMLPELLRENPGSKSWPLRVWRRKKEWIGFGRKDDITLGLAVDLGTTNVAAFLINLQTGERLASLGLENPQTGWGADVINRVNQAMNDSQNAEEIRQAALIAINSLAHDLCFSIGQPIQHIFDVTICGNTAMHHLLLGLPVRQLGRAPFVAVLNDGLDMKARELGLNVAPGAWVHLAPNVGGFIGGDHVTSLLATEHLWKSNNSTLVMDIGTNTEISLIHQGNIYSASAPSGPALEGGHIDCGMRAADGAIERVRFDQGKLHIESIGKGKAVGLCGSGVIDALAAFYQAGLINTQGRIGSNHPNLIEINGKRAIQLAEDVYFTQQDVRAVQLAKAAIRTASDLLLEQAGIDPHHLQAFVIAGAFGNYIDVTSGIDIGLFPNLPIEKFHQVGNAAGLGIRQMLTSNTARDRAHQLAGQCRYLELNTRSDFQKWFINNISFPKNTVTANQQEAAPKIKNITIS
jgi:uncharacterized 2Fe-2S/4Fe-4S cluster protein (DUF4445 family)